MAYIKVYMVRVENDQEYVEDRFYVAGSYSDAEEKAHRNDPWIQEYGHRILEIKLISDNVCWFPEGKESRE